MNEEEVEKAAAEAWSKYLDWRKLLGSAYLSLGLNDIQIKMLENISMKMNECYKTYVDLCERRNVI